MAAKKKASSKKPAAAKPPTKAQIMGHIADKTGMTRKDVGAVFDELNTLVKRNVGRRGPGEFTVPGLVKVRVVKKPARKSRKGINPFTGEEMVFKAKPAHKAIKVTALKALKDML
jgi:nucleoid DNA-binding protein